MSQFDPAVFHIISEVHFRFDLDGNATITDRKVVQNITDNEQSLPGPFKQTVRRTAEGFTGKDSDNNNLIITCVPDVNSDQLILNFNTPSGNFVIPPRATRWFEITYTAYSFAQRIGDVLFLQTRSANNMYPYPINFSYSHTYEFDTESGRNILHKMFYAYGVTLQGFSGTIVRKNGSLIVKTGGTLGNRDSQTNIVFLEARYRKIAASIVAALVGALLHVLWVKVLTMIGIH